MTDKEQMELDEAVRTFAGYVRGDNGFDELDFKEWLLDWRDKAVALAEAKARMGMLEYYDQVPSNDATDWKGLLADNRKQLEYELEKLSQRLAEKEEG